MKCTRLPPPRYKGRGCLWKDGHPGLCSDDASLYWIGTVQESLTKENALRYESRNGLLCPHGKEGMSCSSCNQAERKVP